MQKTTAPSPTSNGLGQTTIPHPPLVWLDASGHGRANRAYFRLEFDLSAAPRRGELCLFVDNVYHLRVNGQFRGYGPLRGYSSHPVYDRYDLTPWLRVGRNVLAVEAYNAGMITFHHISTRAALAAWGTIELADGSCLDLSAPGGWLARAATGYDREAPKFSFTSPPIQVLNEAQWLADWDAPVTSRQGWQNPVILDRQEEWGHFEERPLPFFDFEERDPLRLLTAQFHNSDEEIYSFQFCLDHKADWEERPQCLVFAQTWVHSPFDQAVEAGVFWGEHYLNGSLLQKRSDPIRPSLQWTTLNLREGWNFLFVSYGLGEQVWNFGLLLPRRANLHLSPHRKNDDPCAWMVSQAFSKNDPAASALRPEQLETRPELPGGWTAHPRCHFHSSPARHLAWGGWAAADPIPAWKVRDFHVPAGRNYSLVFDFGGIVLGRIFVEYEAPAGTVIDTGLTEDLLGTRPAYFKSVFVSGADRQIARGGPGRMETFFPRGLRYLEVGISGHTSGVTIRRVGVVSQLYPHRLHGAFRCSDEMFNRVWEMGWNTLRLCSEDVYTDCPWRERTLYAGDMLVEMATALVTSGDTALARRCLDIFIQSAAPSNGLPQSRAPAQRNLTGLSDYPLLAFAGSAWLYKLTGDQSFAERTWRTYSRCLQEGLEPHPNNGLYGGSNRPFIDHHGIRRDGYSCPYNSLVSRAWRDLADLAEQFGTAGQPADFRQRADRTAAAVRTHLWEESSGAFADCLTKDQRSHEQAPSASYWAGFFGAATPAQMERVLAGWESNWEKLLADDVEFFGGPYCCFFLLGCLYEMGSPQAISFAERFMRRQWGIIVEAGGDTLWEHFHPQSSLTHAWSSAPNYYLSTRALGVRLGFPEPWPAGRVLVAPQADSLRWAEGAVPHPLGLIRVRWEIDGHCLKAEIEAPQGVPVDFHPGGRLASLEPKLSIRRR